MVEGSSMSEKAKKPKPRKGPVQRERRQISEEEFLAAILGDIDPVKHAGEGWFSTDEYPTAEDVSDPFLQQEIGREGDYYPGLVVPQNAGDELRKLLARV
jgi:hypothetical protein